VSEELKRDIIRLIDENRSPWVKAAFYSNQEVSSILDRLVNIWESNDRRGIPLDYANEEELKTLHRHARRYASLSDDEARALALGGSRGGEEGGGGLLSFIKRLIKK
jgi:hypothetical protein